MGRGARRRSIHWQVGSAGAVAGRAALGGRRRGGGYVMPAAVREERGVGGWRRAAGAAGATLECPVLPRQCSLRRMDGLRVMWGYYCLACTCLRPFGLPSESQQNPAKIPKNNECILFLCVLCRCSAAVSRFRTCAFACRGCVRMPWFVWALCSDCEAWRLLWCQGWCRRRPTQLFLDWPVAQWPGVLLRWQASASVGIRLVLRLPRALGAGACEPHESSRGNLDV
jgi:hypothetical protein